MTLLEYVASLQDQDLSQDEILSKTKDWKNKNKEEGEVVVSETVELDEVDLGTVKKKDGVPGAVAPSMGPQQAPQPVTEFGLEDTFSVSPAPEIKYNIDGKEVSKEEFDSYSKQKEKEREASEMSFLDRLGLSFELGTVDLGKMAASIPETLYDIASIPQNLAADPDSYPVALRPYMEALKAKGYLDFETSSKSFKEETGVSNPILDYYEEESKQLQGIADIYDNENYDSKSIYENFKKGNYSDGFKLLAQGITRSTPVSLSMMAGGAVTTTGKLAAGSTIGFAGPEISEELTSKPGQSELLSIMNGLGMGAAEGVWESVGISTLGKIYKDIISKEGLDAGSKIFKDGIIDMYRAALVKYGAPVAMVEGGVQEVGTKITQNMIKGLPAFEGVNDAFIQGVGASGVYSSPINISKAGSVIKQGITNNKINKELQNTEFNEAYEAFNPEFPTTEFEIKASQIPGSLEVIDKEVDAKVRANDITNEQGDNIKNRAREVQGAVNQLKPLDVSVQNQRAIVDLMIEQKNLKNTIKQVDNASLTKAESARLSEIDTELGDLITKDKAEKIDIGAKKIAEEIGVGFEAFNTQQDVDSAIATLQEEGGKIDTKNSDNYGTFVVLPDGRRIIVLNKEVATEDRTFTEGQHETGHAVLYETVKNKPEAAVALGKSLLNELQTNKKITIKPEFQARLDQYVEDANISEADTMEEVLTLTSEALTEGTIEINETIGDKIGGFIRRALSAMGMKVKFKNGKDVLNFIKDYNRSVHRQQGLSRGLKKAAVEGVEVAITPKEVTDLKQSVAKESKRVEDSQEVQRLYDEQGVSAAMDIINKFKPITSRIVESRSQAPNFDRQLLTDEIETGPRGILDLIMDYPDYVKKQQKNKEKVAPLAGFINNMLPKRAIEASRRVLGEEFTADVTEAKGVVAREAVEVETKEKPLAKKPTETVEFSQAQVEKIGAKDKAEVENRITETTKEAFKGQDIKTFGQTRNVPKAVADIYAGMFGLNPQTITDKTRNYQKTDAEGLTTAKQFLLKNANNDFARLPETKDGFGKGTFLPRNVMNALYTNGKLTGTLKDYMDLIRQKPTKPIYRDAVGQTIRGLLNLHIRNRMFENLVTTTAKRAVGGAKFSKRKAVEDINIFIENQAFEKVSDELASENKRWSYIAKKAGVDFISSKNPEDVKKMQDWVVNVLAPRIPKSFFTNGTFANAGTSAAKRNFFFTSGMVKRDGTLGELGILLQDAVFAKENDNISKAVSRDTYVTGGRQGKVSERFINKFNSEQFKKEQQAKLDGLKDVFKVFETLMKENKNNTSFVIALLSSTSQGMGHFVRTSAPIKFYAKDVSSGIVEEHTMPASLVAKYLFNSAFAGTLNKDFKNIEKNYFQGALPLADDKKLKGIKPNGKPFNYTEMTPEGWKVTDNIWARYFNINVANTRGGIDPSNIVLSTGKTVFETFSITPSGLKLNEQSVKDVPKVENALNTVLPKSMESKKKISAQQNIYNQSILDEALNEARRPDAPVKKIRVFDFDDTLARSKSKVLYTVPNVEGGFSEGATNLKAIFMVGGPGAGKTNVGKGLQLGRRGYKVVNQDIALEAMKEEAGLPAKESEYTAEQRSTRSKLGAAARKAAVAKFDKYAAAGNGMVIDGTGASYNATTKKIKALQDAGYEVHMVVATTPLETAIERNKARAERSLPDFVVKKTYENVQESLKKYREDFGDRLYEINTETIEYGKPLPNDFLQQVYAGINANKVGKVDASNFATEYDVLESQGAEFDFREFSRVIEGEKGPLFSVAQKIAAARGTDDVFILTARPADAAKPIQEFMKANGIDIPLQNITGLGDGTAAAKGRWIAGKAAEGYNDFYFADDAIKNVQAVKEVLSQVDVKSKVQQAKASKRKTFDKVFNDIIEQKTGIESYKQFSAAKAKTVGSSKGKFTFFTTPSAEDFLGLLYKTLGKGKVGDAQMAFYKENLLDPFNRAEMAISQAKVAAGRDYKALKNQFKNIPKTLEKETGISKYAYQHAIRTYIWDSQGIEVPGLSKRDQKRLTDFIKADPELQAFADQLVNIQKGKPYPKPDKDWTAGNITTDVISGINKVNRAEYLQEWQENVDIIFSEKNISKLEAAFGAKYVEALKDSLRAMKSGSNRPLGGDRVSNQILDWLNNSVGAIMFLNTRSAVLQTISAVNFINWGDNNILKAGKAFANQKQFWGDFLTLMNSDYLLERRDGLKINVSESEIADAVEGSKNKVNAAISYLLNKGFVFTRYADSFAIASGGATFYRNRIESLVEQGMDRKLAEQQAFEDFRLIAEENQQSSSPMRISQQQRSLIGRIVLQFGNTQLQYVRIQKRAVQDLVNGRGDWRANISKIVYYGAIQNLMFNALQSGLAWALFDDDEDDEQLTEKNKEQKLERALNGAIDSQLKGLGIQGAVIAGVKNALMTIAEQADKKSPKFEEALDDLLSIAPALGSKIRKLKSAARTVSWNRKEIKEKGFSMDNPAYLAGAQVISAIFNIPLDRAAMKLNNMRNILNPATQNWQKVALALGWSGWDVGLPYFGLAEAEPVLTETQKQVQKLFNLNKSDQVKMLLDLGLTKKEIRALTKEEQRVDEIIKLQNKNKDGK